MAVRDQHEIGQELSPRQIHVEGVERPLPIEERLETGWTLHSSEHKSHPWVVSKEREDSLMKCARHRCLFGPGARALQP
ncbi:hypothetical protein PPSIR1_13935 [Plesiocystis pacifica SIR-1]|uniref:Uncharacterized protein n=1 Tax=Plesiocystis pacifica SIR-1 TaxID=391625 RepID=A6G8X2_9BACT|nr:hypothetical protein PPSIR1_13935 [Plesiocystis pacifica SIR-1]